MRDMREEIKMVPRPPLPSRREEHIDYKGDLKVPVARSIDPAPTREGWKPRWVNIDLDSERNQGVAKVVTYERRP